MMRLGRAFGRGFRRRFSNFKRPAAQPKLPGAGSSTRGGNPRHAAGIRFRLGVAMAVALLPILVLGAFQSQSDFRRQATEQRHALQLAAGRSSATAKARLDTATIVLEVVSPEAQGFYCAPRLSALVTKLRDYDGLYRYSATGELLCASGATGDAVPTADSASTSAVSSASMSAVGSASMSAVGSASGAATNAPNSVLNTPWFQRLRDNEPRVLERASPSLTSQPSLIAAVRAERPTGRFDGAMLALVPLTSLQPDITDPALPRGSEAALVDAQGRILTATDVRAFTLEHEAPLTRWIEHVGAQGSGLFEADDARGRHRVYAGAALAGRDIYVLLSAPAPGLWSWGRLNPIGSFLLPLGAWLIAFLAVMSVSERVVVRWLNYLERIAAIYARGRFSVRAVQAGNAPSEIRVLAHTLDDLADSIVVRDRQLRESLEEKDALMREIHHRVKNNLQIISSLLSMQQRTVTDAPAKAALGDTRQRISALALIYRTLYQSENIRYADARDFLTELVGQLVASEAGRGPVVTSRVEADSLLVDPDKLAPLALWLVEAVTNAQKHAFAGRGGQLVVRFKVQGQTSLLEVQDDGPGSEDADTRAGVGRTLMGAFAKQLRGEAEVIAAPGGGTIARMSFTTPEAATPTDPADVSRP